MSKCDFNKVALQQPLLKNISGRLLLKTFSENQKQNSIFDSIKIEQTNMYFNRLCSIIKHFVLQEQFLLQIKTSTLVSLISRFVVV